jgi:putative peptide zinc metalloprotease protein
VVESAESGQKVASVLHLTQGTELLDKYEGSGLKEPVYLLRRADGQVIQLSRLLYLVIAEVDGQKDFELIALKVSREFGRTISAENVRFLVEKKLQPLGVLTTNDGSSPKLERAKPMLALTTAYRSYLKAWSGRSPSSSAPSSFFL